MFFFFYYFLKLFTFFCFLMFLSVLLRKSIFVFLFFFFYWVIESIVGTVEALMRMRGLNPNQKMEMAQDSFFFSKIFPLESMSSLIPNPMVRLNMAKLIGFKYDFHYPTESLIACIVWCGLFIFGSYWILKKRDW